MKATRWHKLLALSFSEVVLLAEATLLVTAFDIALKVFPAKTCLETFKDKAVPHRRQQRVNTQRMAWLVEVADRYAPGRSSCLRKAAALAWLLRRRGIAADLRIGVAHEGGNFVAHSWLESEEGELFGPSDRDKYAPLSIIRVPGLLRTGSEQ